MAESPMTNDQAKLRRWLILFFLALAVPSGILIYQAFSQLEWQAIHQQRLLAEEFTTQVDRQIRRLIDKEESYSFLDYRFGPLPDDNQANYPQHSPLSRYPVSTELPGAIGYFQVDSLGLFSTPLLPRQSILLPPREIPDDEFNQRMALEHRIREILSQNRLVDNKEPHTAQQSSNDTRPRGFNEDSLPPSSGKTESMDRAITLAEEREPIRESKALQNQMAFDQLNSELRQKKLQDAEKQRSNLGRVADYKLDYSYQSGSSDQSVEKEGKKKKKQAPKRIARKERIAVKRSQLSSKPAVSESETPEQRYNPIRTFESEIDPFEFSLLDSGELVLFRKVWRDRQRFIQGILLEQQPFLKGIINTAFEESSLSGTSDLIVAYQGAVFSAIKGGTSPGKSFDVDKFAGSVLYQTHLAPPLNNIELIFSVTDVTLGPGATLITWVAIVLSGVLLGGVFLMYRAGAVQIRMAQQQQNFVSAISHELKTPLTSIRMYSELLREGWTPEEKKERYYHYILSESERLTRLINNVLQLARLDRSELQMTIKAVSVASLMQNVTEKIAVQTQRAGFGVELLLPPELENVEIETDEDLFTQIIINLVDNALKFSPKAEKKSIDFGCSMEPDQSIRFSVRDYGPGIAPNQMKKIFKLFYRPENELTRETVGTGIGLALVMQLATQMQAHVDVVNKSPGAEFRIFFPSASQIQS